MFKILRIVCSVIAALILAACAFIFVYLGNVWGIVSLIAALVFFGLTVLFKNLQERQENKLNPPPPQGDFITGPVTPPDKKDEK